MDKGGGKFFLTMKLPIGLSLFLLASVSAFAQATATKPNIVILLADDLGYGDLGCTGSTQIKTPRIDSIAKEGVFCTQGYTAAPVCAPSRCGLMSGKSPARIGNDMNQAGNEPGHDPEFLGLNVKEKTMADRLKALGYTTALVGKWHMGSKPQFHPLKRGFDFFHGFLGGGHNYFPTKGKLNDIGALESNFEKPRPIAYLTDDLAQVGAEMIRAQKKQNGKPLFLFMSFNAPHTPMQATEEDLADFAQISNKGRRTYCAMMKSLDRGVGVILDALKETGMDRNTIVVFMSDNGGAVGTNNSCNAPFNGKKGTLLEGGLRTPFLVRWPEHIKAGSRYDEPVTSLDLTPTFVHAAGGEVSSEEKLDGVDVLPLFHGTNAATPRNLFWRFHGVNMLRSGDMKLISRPDRLPMMFDLKNDKVEQHDLFRSRLDEAEAMQRKLGAWFFTCPDPLYVEGFNWARIQSEEYEKDYPQQQPATDGYPIVGKKKESVAAP